MIEPEKAIPIRLLGVVDQKQRDRIIAEYISETINPYTGHSIDNQSEWTIYQNGLRTEHPQTPAETAPETESTTELISKIELCSKHSDNPQAVEPHATPCFCRFCGASLRSDGQFCEHCGQAISLQRYPDACFERICNAARLNFKGLFPVCPDAQGRYQTSKRGVHPP